MALAWNVDPGQYDVVRQVDGKPLCFTGRTEQYADNSAIAEAVRQSIEKQKLSKSKYGFPPEQLALLGAAGPFEGTAMNWPCVSMRRIIGPTLQPCQAV